MTYGVSEIQAILGDQPVTATAEVAPSSSGRFGDWFTKELNELNGKMVQSEQGLQQLATGDASSVHDVMIRMEDARLSFQLAIQFRTRVMEAYQEVMRMQV